MALEGGHHGEQAAHTSAVHVPAVPTIPRATNDFANAAPKELRANLPEPKRAREAKTGKAGQKGRKEAARAGQ